MSLYTIASQVVFASEVKGVMIDVVQVAVGFSRFARGFVYRTQGQLDEWLADLKVHLRHAEGYARDGYWPQNDKSCQMFGGCAFQKVCSKDPAIRQKFLESNFERKPWNPLQVR
jgi:hypothetical protein